MLRSKILLLSLGLLILAVTTGDYAAIGQSDPNMGFVVARYLVDGSRDLQFGQFQGIEITDITMGFDQVNDLAVDEQGRIVVAGSASIIAAEHNIVLIRYTESGQLDPTFAGNGIAAIDLPGIGDDGARALTLDSQQRIVAGGDADVGGIAQFVAVRYLSDGQPDPAFAGGGISLFGRPQSSIQMAGLAVDGQERIVVAGTVEQANSPGAPQFVVTRLRDDGTVDLGFGNAGWTVTTFPDAGVGSASGLAIDSQGRIVVAGFMNVPDSTGGELFALARYLDNGQLDTTFGNGGLVLTDFSTADESINSSARALAIDGSGRIVVGGAVVIANELQFALARYLSDGSLDPSFGQGGTLVAEVIQGVDDQLLAIEVDGMGRILTAGNTEINGVGHSVVVRFLETGQLDSSFGAGGQLIAQLSPSGNSGANTISIDALGRILIGGSAEL